MSRRRRRGAPELVTILWRDIPAQVTATAGDVKETAVLSDRFQHAIDRAAAVAGLTETKAYVNEWRREVSALDSDDLAGQVGRLTASLEDAFPRDRLESLVQAGGLDPDANHPDAG